MPTRDEIVRAARRYIGTPYHHQAALAGAGCDCLGLIRGVWRDLYGAEPETAAALQRPIGARRARSSTCSRPLVGISCRSPWPRPMRATS